MTHDTTTVLQTKEKADNIKRRRTKANDLQSNPRQPKHQIQQQKTSNFQPFNLDLLNLQPKIYIEVAESLGIMSKDEKFNDKVIEYYNCLPKKINLGLTKDSKISEVLKDITNEFECIKHPESNYMLIHDDDSKTVIVEYLEVPCGEEGACIPIGYLPDIKKKSKEAHDALVKVFQFIYQRTRVNFIGHDDEYGWFEQMADNLMENHDDMPKEDIEANRAEINSYKKGGECYEYYHLIKKGRNRVLSSELNFDTPIPELTNWIHHLRQLFAKEYYPVHKFDFNYLDPNNEDGQALVYSQYIGFYWKQDYVFKDFDEMYNQTAQQIGLVEPSWVKTYGEGFQTGEIKDSQWPGQFHELMKEFNQTVLPQILKTYGISESEYIN